MHGFTLIEAVMVIVILGAIVAMLAVFIAQPVRGYIDTVRRAELSDAADLALRRLTREVRLSLPNSLRVMTTGGIHYIEFIPASGGGRYRALEDGSTGGDFLSFTDTADLSFDVLGTLPANPAIALNDYIVVYNLGEGYAPANAYTPADPCTACNRARVAGISGNTLTLASNPFAAQVPTLPSPGSRFQVVPGSTRAVTYACPATTAGTMQRYANYGFTAAQAAPTGTPALLAANAVCSVEYTSNASGRSGLLLVSLTLSNALSGESATLFQQIHVDNAP
jgi:MSHA biogenesis protein MshO